MRQTIPKQKQNPRELIGHYRCTVPQATPEILDQPARGLNPTSEGGRWKYMTGTSVLLHFTLSALQQVLI